MGLDMPLVVSAPSSQQLRLSCFRIQVVEELRFLSGVKALSSSGSWEGVCGQEKTQGSCQGELVLGHV